MRQRARRPRNPRALPARPPSLRANQLKKRQPRFWFAGPLLGGILAAAAASVMMAVVRWTLQVRTIPERLLEWLLLFLPPGQLEAGLQRFGFDAKHYALYAVSGAILAGLATLGTIVLSRGWRAQRLLALGIGLWLLVMAAIMPLTGAGWFASDLIYGTGSALLGYLAVTLAYVGCLELASVFWSTPGPQPPAAYPPLPVRRMAIVGIGSAVAALAATYLTQLVAARQSLTDVRILDPEEPVPPAGIDPPANHPESVSQRASDAVAPSAPTPRAASAQTANSPPLPEPRPGRPLKRDKDGAILPAGRRQGELTDLITSNDDFYVVTKNAAGDPSLQASGWRLRIDGAVERSFQLDYATLRKLPGVEVTKTLECISNFVGKPELAPFGAELISTAVWKGVRARDILGLVGGPTADATSVAVLCADEYTSALPLDVVMNPATLLVYEMNGEVLPREHGYPARLLVPGRYGMKDAKWVVGLRLMRGEFTDWYGQRNWSREARVKTMTRIDVPPAGVALPSGEYNVAGIAYAGDRGVVSVEFSTDGGKTWKAADLLEPPIANDAWVRWIGRFPLAPGARATLLSRATDGTGAVQEQAFSLPQPDGSTGWPSIEITARDG